MVSSALLLPYQACDTRFKGSVRTPDIRLRGRQRNGSGNGNVFITCWLLSGKWFIRWILESINTPWYPSNNRDNNNKVIILFITGALPYYLVWHKSPSLLAHCTEQIRTHISYNKRHRKEWKQINEDDRMNVIRGSSPGDSPERAAGHGECQPSKHTIRREQQAIIEHETKHSDKRATGHSRQRPRRFRNSSQRGRRRSFQPGLSSRSRRVGGTYWLWTRVDSRKKILHCNRSRNR